MGNNQAKPISLKALVDKQNDGVVFIEANKDFADVLLSFLTMPLGTIIRLLRKQPPTLGTGCMNNLYESVENLEEQQFRTAACKKMLLSPINGVAAYCNKLIMKIDDTPPEKYFLCNGKTWTRFLSHYCAICSCGECISREINLSEKKPKPSSAPPLQCGALDNHNKGVFVKEQIRLIIKEGLQVIPPSTEASLSSLPKLGVLTTIEECNLDIGKDEVLALLKCSLVSKTPLTEALLKHNPVAELGLGKEDFHQGDYIKSRMEEPPPSSVNKKIQVKLIISKSKKMVCYAEASEDFVDLLFSFLTLPLGYIVKQMHSSISKGSINHLYNAVQELDAEKYLLSNEHKAMLLDPKLAPDFGYANHPLGIEEHKHPPYYYGKNRTSEILTTDKMLLRETYLAGGTVAALTALDPKSPSVKTTRGGFVMGPALFTVSDNLIITPISPISCLSLLNKLKVPADDIEERVVQVGHEEALRLLVASFVTESALTNALLREPNPE